MFNDLNNKAAKMKCNKAGKSDTPQPVDFEDCLKKVSSYVWWIYQPTKYKVLNTWNDRLRNIWVKTMKQLQQFVEKTTFI